MVLKKKKRTPLVGNLKFAGIASTPRHPPPSPELSAAILSTRSHHLAVGWPLCTARSALCFGTLVSHSQAS